MYLKRGGPDATDDVDCFVAAVAGCKDATARTIVLCEQRQSLDVVRDGNPRQFERSGGDVDLQDKIFALCAGCEAAGKTGDQRDANSSS